MEQPTYTKRISCPHCHKEMTVKLPEKTGIMKFQCPAPACHKQFLVKFGINSIIPPKEEKKGTIPLDNNSISNAIVIKMKKGLIGHNETFRLKVGPNLIGRDDTERPSDIAIKGDASISRRSVTIDMIPKENGFLYKLQVNKATNPVLHNGDQLFEGESVYLNYGDTFTLGQTLFRFEKKQ